jgi:hypothetical protein
VQTTDAAVARNRIAPDRQRHAFALARQNFDLNNGCPVSVAAAWPRLVFLNREPSGRARRESHFRYDTGLYPSFDVITVEVQRDRPIRTPTQLDDVALLDSDQPHIGGQLAARNAQFECQFVGLRAGNRNPQDKRKRQKVSKEECRYPSPGAHNSVHCVLLD